MLSTATSTAAQPFAVTARALAAAHDNQRASQRIADTLKLVQDRLAPQRRMVRAGESIYQAGERFSNLYILNSGFFKIVNLSQDGREQVVGLKFRGDWLGFDGIANGCYACDAIAMDTGEVWVLRYDAMLSACAQHPALLTVLHEAMSREIARDRDSLMSVRMTRAEIGNYLGMTLETVSRALSRLARCRLIHFAEKGRRDIHIPEVDALADFVQRSLAPAPAVLQ